MPDTEWNSIIVIKNGFKNFSNRKCTTIIAKLDPDKDYP